jgi:hypothetical protein
MPHFPFKSATHVISVTGSSAFAMQSALTIRASGTVGFPTPQHNFGSTTLTDGELVVAFDPPTPTIHGTTAVLPTFNYGVTTLRNGEIVMAR